MAWQKYVITAGQNKYGRKQYVSLYEDTKEWSISVVPSPVSKTKAVETLPRIKREYKEKQNTTVIKSKVKDIEFNIEEYNEY